MASRRKLNAGPIEGKVIAITGGARGIGLATARALVLRGAKVAIGDLDGALAKEVAAGLGGHAIGADLDVTSRESFGAFLDLVAAELGPLDVLVNNAGIMPLGHIAAEPDSVTRRIVDVNLHGVITGTKLAIEHMLPRRRGHVVNVSSGVGRVALPGAATYSATKHAVVGFSEATRAELRDGGIDVSVVLPLIVNTELGSGLHKVRGQRTVEATEVADAIAGVIEKPRFETWVPKSGNRLYRVMFLMPRTWSEAVGRAVGAADALSNIDERARQNYESRARREADSG